MKVVASSTFSFSHSFLKVNFVVLIQQELLRTPNACVASTCEARG